MIYKTQFDPTQLPDLESQMYFAQENLCFIVIWLERDI